MSAASLFPAADEFVEKYLLSPPAPEVAARFERMAVERGGPSR